ncbi:MAG: 1-phosphofructokinase family hexose kinase [Marinosulfonomonas sp.]|nr:1-phosphofructokinase family hexose kinase [Marinosulfonomonas sp.]
MTAIVTITLNPAVDISSTVPMISAGPKLRCAAPAVDPGGGGLNVSRAIKILGGTSTAFFELGGSSGRRLAALLEAEGISTRAFPTSGETRQNFAITETSSGKQYRFMMPGPEWSRKMASDALDAIERTVGASNIVVISGSMPLGLPDDYLSTLIGLLRTKPATVIVDTSGAPLRHLVEHPTGVDFLRLDRHEAEDLAGHPLETRADSTGFAAGLLDAGVADTVLVAHGPDGTSLVSTTQRFHCSHSVGKVVSAVGAGDSFVGGFTLALSRGLSASEALRHGTAAASAAVLTEATRLCRREDADRFLSRCELTTL